METVFVLTGVAAFCGISYAAKGISEVPDVVKQGQTKPVDGDTVKVMTLNIAHGRGGSLHQMLLRKKAIKLNLEKIAVVINRENPHICALQEADARSFYSDKMHHGSLLMESTGLSQYIQGRHVKGMNFIYGTGLLSCTEIFDPSSQVFPFKAPNPTKGFVVAGVKINGLDVDVVSVHLDFLHKKLRTRQVDIMIDHLKERGRPLIIMGDFNCGYSDRSVLKDICDRLELQVWEPKDKTPTFPKTKKRLDWILVSEPLEIVSSEILDDAVSDHLAVVAEIKIK